jgi:hypothetical protein
MTLIVTNAIRERSVKQWEMAQSDGRMMTELRRDREGLLPKPAEVLRLNVGGCLSAATTPESCRNGGWPTQNQNRIGLSPQTAVVFGIPWVGVHGHDAAECCTGRRAEAPPTFRTQTSGLGNRPVRKCSRLSSVAAVLGE